MTSRSGFSLLELMIVVVLLGVLAAIGIPSYQRTLERSYWKEANDLLVTIYHGERSYDLINSSYAGPLDAASTMEQWRAIHMDNPNLGSVPVTFDVSATSSSFLATATRTRGS